MSRVSRYVFKEILGPTLLGLLVYGTVLLMNLLLEAAEMYIRRDLPLWLVARYMALSLPRILVLAIPMAVPAGVLIGIGRLAADSEVTALRACGYSDRRLLVPVLSLGALASLTAAALFNLAAPAANYAQHQLNAQIFLSADINREIQPRVFYERIPNMLIYADEADPGDGTLHRVLIYQRSPAGQEELSVAGTATMSQAQGLTGGIEFQLDQVVSHAWQGSEPELYQISRSRRQVIDRPPDDLMRDMIRSLAAPPPRNLREQTLPELLATLRGLREAPATPSTGRQISETLVEVHKKLSLPATSFVFALFSLPLALSQRRSSGRARGFVISIIVIVLSYAMLTAGEQLADRGRLSPGIAMWAGNVIFLTLGAALMASGYRFDMPTPAWLARRRRRAGAEPAPPGPAPG
ncbi:MAG TPA: LptF/LptG family permease, partial [Candidatus Polarisedimenticolia bacterium]|nr:LptF/LptG family permease [Candidatus Polarisedimenticolia bacterium]